MRPLMLLYRHIVIIFAVLFLIGTTHSAATKPTHSKEETQRFYQFSGQFMPTTTEDHWYVITGLEQLLQDYPDTFLKGDISIKLLSSYSHITDDVSVLTELVEKMFALRGDDTSSYRAAADAFVEKGIRSEKTLFYAQKVVEGARGKQEKWGDYGRSLLHAQTLLARAYQLVGQHQKAVLEIQEVAKGWQSVEDNGITLATRKSAIDRAQLQLLKFYIDEKSWHKAYDLACELLETSVVREELGELWGAAYMGRFGSVKRMAKVYAKLNAERELRVTKRVEKERISKLAPMFVLETLDGETIRLADLKGKPVVVTFWAGRSSLEELPLLSRLMARFRDVEFLAINIDKDSNTRRDMVVNDRFQRGRGLTFVLGDLETRKAFGSEDIPYTCVIDGEGKIRYERNGLGADFSIAMAHQLEWVLSEGQKQ